MFNVWTSRITMQFNLTYSRTSQGLIEIYFKNFLLFLVDVLKTLLAIGPENLRPNLVVVCSTCILNVSVEYNYFVSVEVQKVW